MLQKLNGFGNSIMITTEEYLEISLLGRMLQGLRVVSQCSLIKGVLVINTNGSMV
jgi:hypothetical protein